MASLEKQHHFLDLAKEHNWSRLFELLEEDPLLINVQPGGRWAALHQAALSGDPDIVRTLLQKGADTSARTRDGQLALDIAPVGPVRAALQQKRRSAERACASPEANKRTRVSAGSEAKVQKRLRTANTLDFSSLPDLPVEESPRRCRPSFDNSDESVARRQLELQATNAAVDGFWRCVKNGDSEGVLNRVREDPAVLRERGPLGETPLHMLVLYRHNALARAIVKRYPSLLVDQYLEPMYRGENCLHIAIVQHNKDLIRFLLEMGKKSGLLENLISAKANGLFFQPGKPCYYGESPLGFAVSMNLPDIVEEMVMNCHASLEQVDSFGNNLLHMTVVHRLPEMHDKLQQMWKDWAPTHAVDPDVPLSKRRNNEDLTPMCVAAKYGYCDIFDHMLQASCEIQWQFGPVTSMLLPLEDLDYVPGIVSGAIEHVIQEGHLDLVMLPLIQELLKRKWAAFAEALFIRRFVLALVTAIVFSIMLINPCSHFVSDEGLVQACHVLTYWACKAFVIVVACQKMRIEFRELLTEGAERYFGFSGAILFENATSMCFVMSFIASQILEVFDFELARAALSMSALLSWVYLLWFLLGFSTTGHLVVMIWKIMCSDMVQFACLISIFLMGFSLAFFVSMFDPRERSLNSFLLQLFSCFHMMTSGFDLAAHQDGGSMTKALLVIFSVVVTVLLLNILIAMMNDTYNRVSGTAEQQWCLERARIITSIEQELVGSEREANKYWTEINGKRYLQMEHTCESWARS